MAEDAGARLQVALGLLLQRRHRATIYGELLEPFAGTVDEATYPVLSGLGRVSRHSDRGWKRSACCAAPPTRTTPAPPCSR